MQIKIKGLTMNGHILTKMFIVYIIIGISCSSFAQQPINGEEKSLKQHDAFIKSADKYKVLAAEIAKSLSAFSKQIEELQADCDVQKKYLEAKKARGNSNFLNLLEDRCRKCEEDLTASLKFKEKIKLYEAFIKGVGEYHTLAGGISQDYSKFLKQLADTQANCDVEKECCNPKEYLLILGSYNLAFKIESDMNIATKLEHYLQVLYEGINDNDTAKKTPVNIYRDAETTKDYYYSFVNQIIEDLQARCDCSKKDSENSECLHNESCKWHLIKLLNYARKFGKDIDELIETAKDANEMAKIFYEEKRSWNEQTKKDN
jgi:hypothetical protein